MPSRASRYGARDGRVGASARRSDRAKSVIQRDYILRLIEQAGRALAALRRQIVGGEVAGQAARDEVDKALAGIGLDLDLALRASTGTLELMIASTGEVDPTRTWVLAESLYVYGLSADTDGDREAAAQAFHRAGHLYALLEPGAAFYGLKEAGARVREINERLAESEGSVPSAPQD